MNKLSSTRLGIIVLSLIGLLAACGGNEIEALPIAPEPDADGVVRIEIEGVDRAYDVSSITVDAGQAIEIKLNNTGWLEHNWVLVAGDVDPLFATEADGIQNADSGIIKGGEETTFSFEAPSEPGSYIFVCTVVGHAAEGMWGDFIVQ
ncbi:MAG: plastocyanin/azurin family copper-binding protein [Chloroflexota bacterium]